MDQQKPVLSFGFSKVQEIRNLSKSVISETVDKDHAQEKDFVLSLEDKEVNSTKSSENKVKDYVIPLIKHNKWRSSNNQDEKVDLVSDIQTDNLDLDALAAKEILRESAKYNETWEDRGTENGTISIPLLMQNKIPDGFESEERLDVALRPDEPDEADYDKIPIEQYGMAMLRGMGWNKNRGIGKNAKVVVPIEAQLRPKGLGLGADKNNAKSVAKPDASKKVTEVLELKKNSYCLVTKGTNKDLYGTVEGLDEDNAYVIVKLALSGNVIYVMQNYISLVGKTEFEKYSKYLNKGKADKYKESEAKASTKIEKAHYESNENGSKQKRKKHKKESRNEESHSKRKKHSRDEEKYSYSSEKQKNKKKDSRSQHSDYSLSSSETEDINSPNLRPWLQNDLKVRIVDKTLHKGNYYNNKAVIIDVPSAGTCMCRTEEGRVLENIHQSSLETIVPKEDNAYIAVVSGTHRGQIGQIIKRHKDKCIAVVQLLTDRDNLLKLHYDEICQYVGNVHHHNDY
ncbi:G-patch domain and KOW motifs-containing protein-like [Biomphalaria glabrata]|uniref:G-patch domain and KOW motifs-containing protein-like n=1 Tax=Biomphalaria glabrata TaxID=6526 RepID=A0A9U8ECT9_BIOGL|nr:G-patch domain and KOW motifs-containing protein-like [Biomphalaria glabrata]KAI8773767.1 G patch domain and KOW motifs-containing protein [Biomphalaria glabrata]